MENNLEWGKVLLQCHLLSSHKLHMYAKDYSFGPQHLKCFHMDITLKPIVGGCECEQADTLLASTAYQLIGWRLTKWAIVFLVTCLKKIIRWNLIGETS